MRRRNKEDSNKRKLTRPKTRLGLPDLEHARAAVVGSLTSSGSQREYRRAIDEFVAWYCSPRLSFSKTVVTRFCITLKSVRAVMSARFPCRTVSSVRSTTGAT